MIVDDLITLDFETEGIQGNPLTHSPRPVGCAVWLPGEAPKYWAWGHLHNDNNCTLEYFKDLYGRILASSAPLLFHNAPFDLSVGPIPFDWKAWNRIHDTMYLLFLADPYAMTMSLKPSADRWLGTPPTEQDELKKWILAHVPGATEKNFGAYISKAPVRLVAPYAIGDVTRTRALFELLHTKIVNDGMEAAYDRERRLLPILLAGTRRGIRIDRTGLECDLHVYEHDLASAENEICSLLDTNRDIFDSDAMFCDVLDRCGAVKEWVLTPKSGKRSMAKGNLKIEHPKVRDLVAYRSKLLTCLQTFMRPWVEKSVWDGRLHPNWNQVRQAHGSEYSSKGARTGRLSSDDPNFQNVPTEFTDSTGAALPVPDGLHPLPQLRNYCLPEEGHLWLKRDFSSQEIRILAHFEDGLLAEAYRTTPTLDPHKMAGELVQGLIGTLYSRKKIKATGFSIIYGTGGPGLSAQLGVPIDEARRIKSAYLEAMPGVRDLMYDVQARGRYGQSVRTWGGRVYYVEPPKIIDGQLREFAYKLLNYLIQGSAADQTKESLCDWADCVQPEVKFLATVHDEINISAPEGDARNAMETLRIAMEAGRFDVPFLSEGSWGKRWGSLEAYGD